MKIRALFLIYVFLLGLNKASAETITDFRNGNVGAGEQLNQIERSQNKKERLRSPPKIEEEKEPPKLKTQAATFKVSNFSFEGNKLISSNELQVFLKEYLNREITLDELKLAVDSLSVLYKDKGYLATASLPKQDITEGNVKIIIVEAKFGGTQLKLDPNTKYRIHPEIIQKLIEHSNQKGDVLNLNALDRAVLIADELPGAAVTQSLQSGTKDGETDSLLNINNEPNYVAMVSVDNYGSHATGPVRYQANASFLSPLGIGDRVDLGLLHSKGTDYARLSFNRSIGYSGLRMGINASALKYDVIAGAALSLNPEGTAETLQMEGSYPVYRSRAFDLSLASFLERKHFRNKAQEAVESNYFIDLFNMGSSLNHKNTLFLAGETSASIDLDLGYANYDDSPLTFQASKIEQATQGRFNRLRWGINNTQFFTETISSVLKFNGQLSDSNLDSSQKFYLGGANGVRAYPTSEGSGSEGYLFSAELHKELTANFTATGFYDYGFARQYIDNTNNATGAENATGKNSFNMKGYGTSLEWTGFVGPYRSTFSAIWSRRIRNNPNPQADGSDSDGSRPGNFYWFKASMSF
jgi:hemolysin activation/secretion protein